MIPAAPPLSLSAALAALVEVVAGAVEVPDGAEADPVALAVLVPLVEVLRVALAAAWKAVKFFAAVGLRANTIPFPQWLMGFV